MLAALGAVGPHQPLDFTPPLSGWKKIHHLGGHILMKTQTESQTSDIVTQPFDIHEYTEILFLLLCIWRKEGRKENTAVQSSARAVRGRSDSCAAAWRLRFIPDDGSVAVHDFHWSWQDSVYIRWAELNSAVYTRRKWTVPRVWKALSLPRRLNNIWPNLLYIIIIIIISVI